MPAQIDIDVNAISIEVNVTGRLTETNELFYYVRESARSIFIENIIQGEGDFEPRSDKKIEIKMTGLSTPFTIKPTDSFKVSSFNLVNG